MRGAVLESEVPGAATRPKPVQGVPEGTTEGDCCGTQEHRESTKGSEELKYQSIQGERSPIARQENVSLLTALTSRRV